mmetsp:Transcript_16308/g.56950  ORF Transcript_16308/g.56950 Transcript_16308/m.56950 type:complete len:239 (+) Transcript_16308:1149-1865(+)
MSARDAGCGPRRGLRARLLQEGAVQRLHLHLLPLRLRRHGALGPRAQEPREVCAGNVGHALLLPPRWMALVHLERSAASEESFDRHPRFQRDGGRGSGLARTLPGRLLPQRPAAEAVDEGGRGAGGRGARRARLTPGVPGGSEERDGGGHESRGVRRLRPHLGASWRPASGRRQGSAYRAHGGGAELGPGARGRGGGIGGRTKVRAAGLGQIGGVVAGARNLGDVGGLAEPGRPRMDE